MKSRFLNIALIVTSLVGYLEWGGGRSMFLVQGEVEIIEKALADPLSVAHPFIVLPLIGQILLLVTAFQRRPSRWLTYSGIAMLGLLMAMVCLIGIISFDWRIFVSTLPFIAIAALRVWDLRK